MSIQRCSKRGIMITEYKLTLKEVASAACPCVVIDDAGTPGQRAGSDYLHPDRKTWVAVIINSQQMAEVCSQMPEALKELTALTGASEFHFTEIYRGAGPFKDTPYEMRIGIFEFMRFIFSSNLFPVLVQTMDPRSIAEFSRNPGFIPKVGPFDMKQPSDAALMFLLLQIRRYLRENRCGYAEPGYVAIDEGFRPANRCIMIPTFDDVFKGSNIYSVKSSEFCPVQLADFAALCVAKTQWLMTKEARSRADDDFLPILADIRLNVVNLPETSADLSTWTSKDYESVVDEDRRRKGLRPYREDE